MLPDTHVRIEPPWKTMRFSLQWTGVILLATAVDLLVRFGGFADFRQVLWVETLLFPLTGLVLHRVFHFDPNRSGFRRGLQTALVWAFYLAGLRSGIWAAGFPVGAANLVVLIVAIGAWLGFRLGKRRK